MPSQSARSSPAGSSTASTDSASRPVVRPTGSYGAQPGSPLLTNSTQTRCTRSATGCEGASPSRGRTSSRVIVSNTNGSSAPWQAPSPWLSPGSGESNRYIQVAARPAAQCASATRIAGTRKNQSRITAPRTSPAPPEGRLARYTARPSPDRPYAPATAASAGSSIRPIVPAATRNSRASSRLVPVSRGKSPARPGPGGGQRRRGQHRAVHDRRERQQAQRELPPAGRVRCRLHLHDQVGRGAYQLVQRHGPDRLPVRTHPQRSGPDPAGQLALGRGVRVCAGPALGD